MPVAQLDAYRGLIFATWDPTAPTLDEYLGDMKYYLDLQFGRRPGGTEVIPGTHKWQMPCNWKFAADNFVGDLYHAPYSHGSAVKVQGRTAASNRRRAASMQVSPGGGHGMGVHRPDLDDSRGARQPSSRTYIDATRPEVAQHLSYDQAYRVAPVHSTIFPNFSFLNNGTMRVWHPKGPEKMEVWAWVVVEKDAPPEVKRAILRNSQYNFNVSGMFEQDDGENWNQCSASSRGYIGRQHDFNYQMGLGHDERMEEFPGRRGFAFSEINQRGFYKRWREMMTLDTWDELRPGLRSCTRPITQCLPARPCARPTRPREGKSMEYTLLGRTGVRVSRLALGTATFGVAPQEQDAINLVHKALDLGINFFDTAVTYGNQPRFDRPGAPPAAPAQVGRGDPRHGAAGSSRRRHYCQQSTGASQAWPQRRRP